MTRLRFRAITPLVVLSVALAACSSSDEEATTSTSTEPTESTATTPSTGAEPSATTVAPIDPADIADAFSCGDVENPIEDPIEELSKATRWVVFDLTNINERVAGISGETGGARSIEIPVVTLVEGESEAGEDASSTSAPVPASTEVEIVSVSLTDTDVDAIKMVGQPDISEAWMPVIPNDDGSEFAAGTIILQVADEWVFGGLCATQNYTEPLQAEFGDEYNQAVRSLIGTSGDVLIQSVEPFRQSTSTATTAPG